MSFHPMQAAVPTGMRTDRVVLRPLSVSDVEIDYDAVKSSAPMLRRWSQTSWPADDFTLAENRADLERHEHEHREGVAFTFTVLDPTATRCLGCVYIAPPAHEERALIERAKRPARVGFWVRAAEIPNELDRHLLGALREWLAREWAFDLVIFTIAEDETRQAALLGQSGLEGKAITREDGRRRCVFL
jgi:hypothetical protein